MLAAKQQQGRSHQCTRSATVRPRRRLTVDYPRQHVLLFAGSQLLPSFCPHTQRRPIVPLPHSPATSPSRRGHVHHRQLTKTRAPNIGHSSLTQALLHPIAHRPRPPGTNALPGMCAAQNPSNPCPVPSPQPHARLAPACLPYKYPANAYPPRRFLFYSAHLSPSPWNPSLPVLALPCPAHCLFRLPN